MRKSTTKRLVALFLALLMLLGTGTTVAYAEQTGESTNEGLSSMTDLERLRELLNTRSFEEYLLRYKDVPLGTQEIIVPLDSVVSDNAKLSDVSNYPNVYITPQFKIEDEGKIDEIIASLGCTKEDCEVIYDYPEENKDSRKYFYIKYTKKLNETGTVVELANEGMATFTFEVPESGMYSIVIEYYPIAAKSANIERMLLINDKVHYSEARSISMTKSWTNLYYAKYDENGNVVKDKNGNIEVDYRKDVQGNDIRAEAVQTPKWRTYTVTDSSGYYNAYQAEINGTKQNFDSLMFNLEKGTNTIALDAEREPVAIKSIKLVPPKSSASYADYLKSIEGKASENDGVEPIYISAELFDGMSDESIYGYSNRSSSVTLPQSSDSQLINVLGGATNYKTAGQWVSYTFTPEKSGYYNIMARYNQAALAGMFTSRTIKINGEVLFAEARNTRFDYNTDWQLEALGDGTNTFMFYFEGGVEYTVEFEVSLGELANTIGQVQESLSVINDSYLEILKLTGAEPDEYRDYGFSRLMPEVLNNFVLEYNRLDGISKKLTELCGEKGSHVATLDQVSFLLERMGRDEDEIAKNLKTLKSYIGTLGTWLNDSRSQPVMFDYFLIVPVETTKDEVEEAGYDENANFFEAAWFEIKLFIQSFFTDYSNMGATVATDEDPVEVWISEGRDQALIIRNLVDSNFTPQQGISVDVKLVAPGTLLPSVLSGLGPDAFIGLGSVDTINYAIRDAVLPLNGFAGFKELEQEFVPEAMLPLTLEGETFGIPEKMSFSMMFYRQDILADLGIEIPKTWDDVLSALPVLQSNNMQIGLQRDVDLFLYQLGGDRWASNGMECGLGTNEALEAFQYYCEFYTMYSFPVTYDASNRFRTGEMPIVIGTYTAMYNTLTVFATEIQGLWDFTVLPGVQQDDGSINNQAVCAIVGLVMLNGCEDKENTWEFIKWFCGADAQAKYSNNLITTIGNAAKHPTANIKALEEMPWNTSEYKAIEEQFNNMAAIANYPGSYIFDRYLSFAFYDAYNEDKDPVESLRSYIKAINDEITRKRQEFDMPVLDSDN